MSRVTYNQPGYIGTKWSEGAQSAYDDGEMPKSRWTKKAMLARIAVVLYENNLEHLFPMIKKMKKDEIFNEFFTWSSWHHTGKFARETDFYELDEGKFIEKLLAKREDQNVGELPEMTILKEMVEDYNRARLTIEQEISDDNSLIWEALNEPYKEDKTATRYNCEIFPCVAFYPPSAREFASWDSFRKVVVEV